MRNATCLISSNQNDRVSALNDFQIVYNITREFQSLSRPRLVDIFKNNDENDKHFYCCIKLKESHKKNSDRFLLLNL